MFRNLLSRCLARSYHRTTGREDGCYLCPEKLCIISGISGDQRSGLLLCCGDGGVCTWKVTGSAENRKRKNGENAIREGGPVELNWSEGWLVCGWRPALLGRLSCTLMWLSLSRWKIELSERRRDLLQAIHNVACTRKEKKNAKRKWIGSRWKRRLLDGEDYGREGRERLTNRADRLHIVHCNGVVRLFGRSRSSLSKWRRLNHRRIRRDSQFGRRPTITYGMEGRERKGAGLSY